MLRTVSLAFVSLIIAACAEAPYQPPVVRAAVAQAQMTTTQSAETLAQVAPAQTERAQSISATGTAQSVVALATEQAVSATGTAMMMRATTDAANVTATAEWRATDESVVWGLTQQALDEQAVRNSQLVGLILTQTAGEASATAARLGAQTIAYYILFVGGAVVVVIIGLAVAFRFAGESILHAGDALAAKIKAEAEAYSARTGADADGWATEIRASVFSHGHALINIGTADGLPNIIIPPRAEADPPPSTTVQVLPAQNPQINSARGSYPLLTDAGRQELSNFLWRCVRASGGQADRINTIPSDDTLRMGAGRRAEFVGQLAGMGFVQVIPNTGTLITAYPNLTALARAVSNGAGTLPSPTPDDSPTPSQPVPQNGQNGQNGQNTLRSGTAVER